MRNVQLDLVGLLAGSTTLAAVVVTDVLSRVVPVPAATGEIHNDLLVVALAATVISAVVRYTVAPVREAFLHGWHTRIEEEARQRLAGEEAKVYRLPPSAFASDLAPAVPDDGPRHRAAGRRPTARPR